MKKVLLLLVALMILSLCACGGFDQNLYDENLSGKIFENDGRVLQFNDDNCMTYNYTNLIGNSYKDTYSITEIVKDGDNITMTVKQINANTDIENTDEELKVYYNISDNTIKHYSVTYKSVK